MSWRRIANGLAKPAAFWLLAAPAFYLAWRWARVFAYDPAVHGTALLVMDPYLADPVGATHVFLGDTAIRVLLLSLAMTPLRDWTGWSGWVRIRRRVGLFAFGYVAAHIAVYVGFELQWSLAKLWDDVLVRRYITVGMLSFALLIPLAVTSHNAMIRRLGPVRWRRLHWLAYPIAVLAVLHHIWVEKGLQMEPLVHAGVLAVLLGHRVVMFTRRELRARALAAP